MKILQTVAGFSVAGGGGITTCTYRLLRELHRIGTDIDILTPDDPVNGLIGNGEGWIHTVAPDGKTPYGYSRNLKHALLDSDYDIYHTNGLWMHVNHLTATEARKKRRPFVLSPHGMLYPEALHRSYWKKWPLIKLFFGKDVREASCIHATCSQEADTIRDFGYNGRIEVIPNPTILPENINEFFIGKAGQVTGSPRRIGFLGRIHPRKGIELLLDAMAASIHGKEMELVIIGGGDQIYVQFLKEKTETLGLRENIHFAGFVDGDKKFRLLASLSALFVPSDFENFGMIVPEALATGTPVMASKGTPWQELNDWGCGWWIDRTPTRIAEIIDAVATMPTEEIIAMGQRGHQLIFTKYTADRIANQMKNLYQSLIKN